MQNIATLDIFIISLYFVAIMAAGFWVSRRKEESSSSYFLAGRNVGWFAIGTSLFATNISSEHFVGLAGSGAARGLAVGNFEWLAIIFVILLGWVFAPIYLKSGVYTLPELMEKRFNASSRIYLAGISIMTYMFTKVAVTILAGGLLLEKFLGWDVYTSAVVMIVLTGIYTVVGGLSAVVYTSVVQAFVLIGGAALLTVVGLNEVGGLEALRQQLPADYFSMVKPVSDPDFPWTGILFGAPILGIWYWCTDQYMVQRVLGAKSISHARTGTILTGFLKVLPVFIMVLPGMIAVALFPDISGDEAYPMMVASSLLPAGIRGLVIAGLLAALMSSLAGSFHSTSTLITMDYYRMVNPAASERKLVLVGRLSTTIIVITAILWVPLT
ncbi:MAG: sodium/solute symporter, partial [Calditrichia bacterium]